MNLTISFLSLFVTSLVKCEPIRHKRTVSSNSLPSLKNSSNNTSEINATKICQEKHKNNFLYQVSLTSNGCSVECAIFSSSSDKYEAYYNVINIYKYSLENRKCGFEKMCKRGQCYNQNELPGRAELRIIRAKVSGADLFSEADTYVKVALHRSNDTDIIIGSTTTVYDDNYPFFDQTFVTPLVNKLARFHLEVYDKDSSPDDFMGSFDIHIKESINQGILTKNFKSGWLTYSIKWHEDNGLISS